MPRKPKKLVEAHRLSEDDNKDGFLKGCALIRANLGIDPEACGYGEWAVSYAQALWLEQWRMQNRAKLLAALFGQKK